MNENRQTALLEDVSLGERVSYGVISLVHDTLYGKFRDPYPALWAAGLAPGQRVLEAGCGPGHFTLPAARLVGETGEVYAVDVNPLAISRVRERVCEAGVTNVRPILADLRALDLPAAYIDVVLLFGLGHARGGLDAVWRELGRVLRPGGILAVEGNLSPPALYFTLHHRHGRIRRYLRGMAPVWA